ncbi:sugar phosphate isomerase/epimerase [Methanococcoides sp. SA1]|nr:sugar phosphate isomerase/epimerase [Methanococcoides sp. SA1]
MEIAISNIAWDPSQLVEHLELLRDMECKGLEIAPSAIWQEPTKVNQGEIVEFIELIHSYGLKIISMHSLTYTHPELKMFSTLETREKLKEYLFELIDLASKLNCPVMIFGSPQSRKVGTQNYDECFNLAVSFFKEIGMKAQTKGILFCIEPLGPSDNCDFITNADEAYKLITTVGCPNFSMHLDAKAMMDVNENYQAVFTNYGDFLKHFHVGDPGLNPPGTITDKHIEIAAAINNSSYEGYVSIEMKITDGESMEIVTNAINYVKKIYLKEETV